MTLLKPKIRFLVRMMGFVIMLLFALQAALVYYGVQYAQRQYDDAILDILLEVHHCVEEDPSLSNDLITILRATDAGEPVDANEEALLIKTLHHKIDSVSKAFGIDLTFEFVVYDSDEKEIYLRSAEHLTMSLDFLNQSERAGWRVKKAFGGNRFRIGLEYYNEYFYFLSRLQFILVLSVILIGLLVFTFYFSVQGWRKQKELTEMKNNFVNNLTHELRTPIFSIGLLHSMIRKQANGHLPPEIKKYLELLELENSRMKRRVDKVVEIAMLESSQLQLDRQAVDVHALLLEGVELQRLTIEEKGGDLLMQLQAARHHCAVDRVHLDGVIHNLVDNAIKYGGDVPKITVSTECDDHLLIVKVHDEGIGVHAGNEDRIFEKFYRESKGDIHPVKGLGLGLSYVKSIVEAHDGQVYLDRGTLKGTTFIVKLPLLL